MTKLSVLIVALTVVVSACSKDSIPTAPTANGPVVSQPAPTTPPVATPDPTPDPTPTPPTPPKVGLSATAVAPLQSGASLAYQRDGQPMEDRRVTVEYNPPAQPLAAVDPNKVEYAVCLGNKEGYWIVGTCSHAEPGAREYYYPTLLARLPYHTGISKTSTLIVLRTKGMNWEALTNGDPYQMPIRNHTNVLDSLVVQFEINWHQ